MDEHNISTDICKHNTTGRGYVTAEKWEIGNWEVEIVPSVIDFSVKSSICVKNEEKIKV